MTMRRTLDIPDAPGVWIWHRPDWGIDCVRVLDYYGNGDLYYYNFDGDLHPIDELTGVYTNGKWQGPIEWEEA